MDSRVSWQERREADGSGARLAVHLSMVITGRSLLLGLSAIVAAVGVVMWIDRQAHWLALVAAGCGLLSIVILNIVHPPETLRRREPEEIEQLMEQRRRELVRGTSMYLRQMHYR